jgi:hypothetical protein
MPSPPRSTFAAAVKELAALLAGLARVDRCLEMFEI